MNAAMNFCLVIFFAWSQQCFAARQARLPQPPQQDQPPGPLGPQALSPNQCGVGAMKTGIANITDYATAGVLYVDTGRPAQCSGEIVRWEVCYVHTSGEPNVTILVIRENNAQSYRISAHYQLDLEDASEIGATCQYIEAIESVLVEAGDVIGFYSENVRIAFSTHDSTPVLSRYTPLLQGSNGVLGIDTLQQNQLQQLNENVAPIIRLIMNSTDENSTVTPTPTPTTTSRTPCPTKKGKGGFVSKSLFTSVVAVAVVVIFILFVMVCLLVCCLCGAPCVKCCKLLKCFSRRKQAEPTKKATSQVAQPITDQSMQYNDMYVPRDPTQIITGGKKFKAHIFGNPAYDTPTSKLKKDRENISPAGYDIPISKFPRRDQNKNIASFKTNLADLTCSEIDGELEHTYETISG